jgi:GAF domain-containing protein
MRATTVRFNESLWQLLDEEARREGVSAAQFVRDATVMRIAYSMGRRADPRAGEAFGGSDNAEPWDGVARAGAPADVAAAVRDPDRLRALKETGLLDSDAEPRFDRHARLAAQVLNAPVALVSLVDRDRQFFKSCLGLPEPWASQRESPLTHSFCQHTLARGEPLVIDDAREHPVLRDNLAIRDMGVVAYAGVPLLDARGNALGTLCVIDSRPRQWSSHQLRLLADMAASVVTEIEFTRTLAGVEERAQTDPAVGRPTGSAD